MLHRDGVMLPVEQFGRRSRGKTGYRQECKACARAYQREYYARTKEHMPLGPRIDAAPLAAWIRSLGPAAERITGLSARTITDLRRGKQKSVSLELADRATLFSDMPLDCLYPGL